MKTTYKLLAIGMSVGLLGACEGTQIERAKTAQATGSEFTKKLYSEYYELSKSEYDEGDYQDSDRFAMRAISAAGGKVFDPEPLNRRALPQGASGELSDARGRLIGALAKGAREKMPEDTAHAQAMFDCWMQEQEENFQPKDIARCRAGFLDSMAKVDAGMTPVKAAMAEPEPAPMVKKAENYVVYFPFDSDKVTGAAQQTVLEAIDAAKRMGASHITLAGHTDRAGQDKYNTLLSMQRIRAVAAQMNAAGISTKIITPDAYGENAPAVPTPDGVAEPQNRRVEIKIIN